MNTFYQKRNVIWKNAKYVDDIKWGDYKSCFAWTNDKTDNEFSGKPRNDDAVYHKPEFFIRV